MQDPLLRAEDAEAVIRQYAGMVYRLAFARSGTREDADEIFQEVFLRYVKKQPAFENETHRRAWLIRVTVNCAKKLRQNPWRRRTVPLEEETVFESREAAGLYWELQKLPPKYRQVIHLYYYEDLTAEEIGRLLRRKSSTVRTQLTRARALLRQYIKEEDDV